MLADPCAVQLPKGLPPICAIKGIGFYAPQYPSEQYLFATFKLFEDMSLEKLLFHFILPGTLDVSSPTSQMPMLALADFILRNSSQPCHSWVEEINRFPIIPLQSRDPRQPQRFERLSAVIDPKSPLANLYFDTEDVWPEPRFFEKHQHALGACGLVSTATCRIAVERARFFSGCHDLQQLVPKVRGLLAMAIDFTVSSSESPLLDIVNLAWLPVRRHHQQSLALLPPSRCRGSDDAALVDCILGVFDSEVLDCWKDLYVSQPRLMLTRVRTSDSLPVSVGRSRSTSKF